MKNPSKEQLEAWHKDPNNWICGGLFYYNKEDERLLPPKRVAFTIKNSHRNKIKKPA